MATEARIVANRLNAKKSTGPRTAQGKAAVSQNAVTHGLSGQCDVIRGEDQEEFELYREELFWELNPAGTMQSRLAERIVSLAWRLRRAERIQNQTFDYLMAQDASSPYVKSLQSAGNPSSDPDLALGRTVAKDYSNARVVDRLAMYERRIELSLYRTMAELQRLRRVRELEPDAEDHAHSEKATIYARQCQIPPMDGGHSPPYKTGDTSHSLSETVTDCAKQSQSPADEEASSVKCDVSSGDPVLQPSNLMLDTQRETPYGVTASEAGGAEQSPSAGAATVDPASSKRDEETPCGVTTNEVDAGSPKGDQGTPEGVTPNGEEAACKTTPTAETGASEGKPAVQPAPCPAKQSQRPPPATRAAPVPRARPRVAYHYHNMVRSY